MARQQLIERADESLQVWSVLDEAALRLQVQAISLEKSPAMIVRIAEEFR